MMAARLPLAAAGRSLRELSASAAGSITRERLDRLVALVESSEPGLRELNLGEVTGALFPGAADPVGRFRAFRAHLRRLAAEQDVVLDCEVDGHKHAPARARSCWFTGTDDGVRRMERMSEAATATATGSVVVDARARRAVRICIDGARIATATP